MLDEVNRQVVCDGRTVIEPGDEVFVLAASRDIRHVLDALRRRDRPVRRVFIAGGGRIGLRLARQIEDGLQVKIIETDLARCEYLGGELSGGTLVLHGDSTDEELLESENVAECDLFAALTSDDEDNIMACLLAKRLGAHRVLALINRRAYAELVQGDPLVLARKGHRTAYFDAQGRVVVAPQEVWTLPFSEGLVPAAVKDASFPAPEHCY